MSKRVKNFFILVLEITFFVSLLSGFSCGVRERKRLRLRGEVRNEWKGKTERSKNTGD